MLSQLYGTCNGQAINLQRISEEGTAETWQISVPRLTDTFILELWAVDEAGNRTYYATVKMRPDGITTVLKITSVIITPNPTKTDDPTQIEVVIEQEHYQYIPYSEFEFDFSNESLDENLIEMADLVLERTYDAQDTELQFVRYKLLGDAFVNLTYDQVSKSWKGTFKGPPVSSWHETDHIYPIWIEAEDEEGNSVKADLNDPVVGESLKLRVLDKIPPTITLGWPTNLAYVTSANPQFEFSLFDNSPGIDFETLQVLIDGTSVPYRIKVLDKDDGSKTISCVTDVTIPNGEHYYAIRVSDYDGNTSTSGTRNFTLDTTAGNGETFNIDEMTFEWYRFQKLVQSGVKLWMEFDINMLFTWMKSLPELGDHFFQVTKHHDDDKIVYKLKVEVKR